MKHFFRCSENNQKVAPPVAAVADDNDRRPGMDISVFMFEGFKFTDTNICVADSASVAVQTNNPLLTAKNVSQSTQTLEEKDLNPVVTVDAPSKKVLVLLFSRHLQTKVEPP